MFCFAVGVVDVIAEEEEEVFEEEEEEEEEEVDVEETTRRVSSVSDMMRIGNEWIFSHKT